MKWCDSSYIEFKKAAVGIIKDIFGEIYPTRVHRRSLKPLKIIKIIKMRAYMMHSVNNKICNYIAMAAPSTYQLQSHQEGSSSFPLTQTWLLRWIYLFIYPKFI